MGLEDLVNEQDAQLRRRMEAGRQRELQAAKNLADFRDLMVARGVRPDDVYTSCDDLSIAARGWVVSDRISDSMSSTASYTGKLVTEEARLFGFSAWPSGQKPVHPSAYYTGGLFLTLSKEQRIDHDFGLNDALDRLATAARRYLG